VANLKISIMTSKQAADAETISLIGKPNGISIHGTRR
jgi:hypothetical protein